MKRRTSEENALSVGILTTAAAKNRGYTPLPVGGWHNPPTALLQKRALFSRGGWQAFHLWGHSARNRTPRARSWRPAGTWTPATGDPAGAILDDTNDRTTKKPRSYDTGESAATVGTP